MLTELSLWKTARHLLLKQVTENMTQTQKIIAAYLGKNFVAPDERIYITNNNSPDATSLTDKYCGAYGRLYINGKPFNVPKGIFIDLTGVLRNDATSSDAANFILAKLQNLLSSDISVEFGGDSMTFLTMDDRFEITSALLECNTPPMFVTFEYDYITAEYTMCNFGKKPAVFFNDGPESYLKIVSVDLSEV